VQSVVESGWIVHAVVAKQRRGIAKCFAVKLKALFFKRPTGNMNELRIAPCMIAKQTERELKILKRIEGVLFESRAFRHFG